MDMSKDVERKSLPLGKGGFDALHLNLMCRNVEFCEMEKFMITIFNRKQLIITYDMSIQSKIRNILAANNVDYSINPIMGLCGSTQPKYKIYVHKKDYEQACYLIKDVFI